MYKHAQGDAQIGDAINPTQGLINITDSRQLRQLDLV